METLAQAFPLLATLAVIVLVILLLRAVSKRSAGATDAGPVVTETAPVPGLSAAAWDLRSIDHVINNSPDQTVDMLLAICRDEGIDPQLTAQSGDRITFLVDRLERHLELRPTDPPAIVHSSVHSSTDRHDLS